MKIKRDELLTLVALKHEKRECFSRCNDYNYNLISIISITWVCSVIIILLSHYFHCHSAVISFDSIVCLVIISICGESRTIGWNIVFLSGHLALKNEKYGTAVMEGVAHCNDCGNVWWLPAQNVASACYYPPLWRFNERTNYVSQLSGINSLSKTSSGLALQH